MEKESESKVEKGSRWLRNFNAAVGGIALAGAALSPPGPREVLLAYAAIQGAQVVAFEGLRRFAKNRRKTAPA